MSPSIPVTGELVYIGDVMCSWCWGFAPTLHQIEERSPGSTRVVNGGLRPGPYSQLLDDQLAGYLSSHWTNVAAASGQPFDPSSLDRRDGWRFDSELPAIAVAAMRDRHPGSALRFFTDLQKAFFADGIDITEPEEYSQLLTGYEVDPPSFVKHLLSPEAQRSAWQDFGVARSFGVTSFPTLLLQLGDSIRTIARGWQLSETVDKLLRDALTEQGFHEPDGGESCQI